MKNIHLRDLIIGLTEHVTKTVLSKLVIFLLIKTYLKPSIDGLN